MMTAKTQRENLHPILSTLFDVEFTSIDLSDEEKKILSDCVVSMSEKKIKFGLFYDENKKRIVPLEEIIKFNNMGRRSDVIVSILGKDGSIIGNLIYKECNVEVDFAELFNFSYDDPDSCIKNTSPEKVITLKLYPDAILYNNIEL